MMKANGGPNFGSVEAKRPCLNARHVARTHLYISAVVPGSAEITPALPADKFGPATSRSRVLPRVLRPVLAQWQRIQPSLWTVYGAVSLEGVDPGNGTHIQYATLHSFPIDSPSF